MCCGGTICRLCTCVILLAVVIGLIFGFGVFQHGFDKLKHTFHACDVGNATSCVISGRPLLGYGAPVPL